jgi:hypothetical protein
MDIVLQTNATDPALVLRDCHRLDAHAFECSLCVRSSGFVAERQFWFQEPEFSEFRRQLAEMDKSLKCTAELRTRYEENGFRLEVHGNGAVRVSGTLREYGARARRVAAQLNSHYLRVSRSMRLLGGTAFLIAAALMPQTVIAQGRVAASRSGPTGEVFLLDLDGDGIADTLTLHRIAHPVDPGVYDTLSVHLSLGGRHSIGGSWDALRSDEMQRFKGNLVKSRAVYVARFAHAGTLIFLFGEDVGCCLQSLDVYRASTKGLERYLNVEEFSLMDDLRPDPREITLLSTVEWMREAVGSTAPGYKEATTYGPVFVIQLDVRARIDTLASAAATRAAYGGFAGLSPQENIRMIVGRGGSRYLWDEKGKHPVP